MGRKCEHTQLTSCEHSTGKLPLLEAVRELRQSLTLSIELGLLQHTDDIISRRQVGKLFFQDGENVLLLLWELRIHGHPLEQDAAWKAWVQMLLSSLSISQDRNDKNQCLYAIGTGLNSRTGPYTPGCKFGKKDQDISTQTPKKEIALVLNDFKTEINGKLLTDFVNPIPFGGMREYSSNLPYYWFYILICFDTQSDSLANLRTVSSLSRTTHSFEVIYSYQSIQSHRLALNCRLRLLICFSDFSGKYFKN